MTDADLDALCERYGIVRAYHDIWGAEHVASDATKRALLAAMGVLDETSEPVPPPLVVWREGDAAPVIDVPQATTGGALRWRLHDERGQTRDGACDARDGKVTCNDLRDIAAGYHGLSLLDQDAVVAQMTVAVCPRNCHRLSEAARVFGPAIQLYALRSSRNWGIGDFTDLAAVIEVAAAHGASFVGVNPLHEPFLQRPEQASPYSPSTRLALNPLYLDVEAIADFAECSRARQMVATPEFQAQIAALRATDLVDYAKVAVAKRSLLNLLFMHFHDEHLMRPSDRGHAFRAFVDAHREEIGDAALFDAMQADFSAVDANVWGWPAWPEPYRDRLSTAVEEFARDYAHRVDLYLYLQWQAHLQLAHAKRIAEERGMVVGIYRDLAVGANPGGSETWQRPHLFATGAHVGAPPDEFNRTGQDWGLPPWIPHRLRESSYAPWISLLRANMRHAGGLRIDHVMGLMRLYWIAQGMTPVDGAYVRYPLADLLALLALESARHHCIVVGEDLGTVPDEVRRALHEAGVYSYRVLYFERTGDGGYVSPASYPRQALVAVSTHDLPTLRGFCENTDLAARDALRAFADDATRDRMYAQRQRDRERLAQAFASEGLAAPDDAIAAHRFVARAPSALMTVQLEDVFGQAEQVNLPATTDDQYPNWRRKIGVAIEDWARDGRFAAVCEAIRSEGRGPLS